MSQLFGNLSNDPRMERQALASKYSAARSNLLLVVVFTALNLLLLATNSGTYFLFSASVPYLIGDLGMFLCGRYPEEYYEGLEGMFFLDTSFFVIMMVIAFLILALYMLCWFFSKKNNVKWLIVSLVLFSIDTLVMFLAYGLAADMIVNVIFHVWVIVILAMGIKAHYKLKSLPQDDVIEAEFSEIPAEDGEGSGEGARALPGSTPIRVADTEVKARILLDGQIYGHNIVYRRIKRTNELVIDGNVYDEYTAIAEMPHMLTATIDGHTYAAGLDNSSHSYMLVDGQTVKSKMRLV